MSKKCQKNGRKTSKISEISK